MANGTSDGDLEPHSKIALPNPTWGRGLHSHAALVDPVIAASKDARIRGGWGELGELPGIQTALANFDCVLRQGLLYQTGHYTANQVYYDITLQT